ncbi:MAG: hypothetical protein D8M51_11625 [Ignavibacteriae bacterium]|nr:hypothetical protein [Ignavibacteriota bacterium]HOJ06946.1 hypothetical protein [Ignavibacteriaceae bacterium]
MQSIIFNKFKILFEVYGFELIESKKWDAFDNAEVKIKSNDFYLIFVRDRGIISVELASIQKPDKFYELDFIKELIENQAVNEDISFVQLIEFFINNYEKISELFLPDRIAKTEFKLKELKQEWIKKKYPDI